MGQSLAGTGWCRGNYALQEESALALKGAAEVEVYDPWVKDAEARKRVDQDRPYKALMRLTQQIDLRHKGLPTRQRQRLEAWVRSNGLLGVLPHQTLSFATRPRWVNRDEYIAATTDEQPPKRWLWAVQRTVVREGGLWYEHFNGPLGHRLYNKAFLDQPVASEDLTQEVQPAQAVLRRVETNQIEIVELSDAAWWRFFGAATSGSEDCPSFGGDGFWLQYREPLVDFLRAARWLTGAVGEIERATRGHDKALMEHGYARLARLASPASLAVWMSADGPRLGWSAPSLLSCFAVLALQDLAGGQTIRQCQTCGALFLTKAHDPRFCSTTCRTTNYKREWRQRNPK